MHGNMQAIIQDIISIFFVLALGYVSGRRRKFTQEQAQGLKLVLQPASMLGLALWLGIGGDKLEQLLLLSALPSVFTGVVLAGRYQTYIGLASSTLVVTSLAFAAAAPAWLAVARLVAR